MFFSGFASPTTRNVFSRARNRARREVRKLEASLTTGAATRRADLVGLPDVSDQQSQFQFQFLKAHGLSPEHRVVDLGCGILRVGVPLIEYLEDGHYIGIEKDAKILKAGRKELAKAGLGYKHPQLILAGHPDEISIETSFDVAWAYQVFFHLPDEIADAYLGFVSRNLAAGGVFYVEVCLGPRFDSETRKFPFFRRPRDFYEQLASSRVMAMEELGSVADLGGPGPRDGNYTMLRFTHASHAGAPEHSSPLVDER
jgi:SAM-dependent methyltransferase